ncbi:LexA family transcriptional regulator [Nitratidesulfovibrio termitidis]|uniref:LexA family transcriptional regulator n=1 Tax=Nitratidesulfovibrio termitidis TaxID=42252 RepID=UPI0004031F2D|nr:S24 family peptidase [Nitratidesulfovibrio termitidis]
MDNAKLFEEKLARIFAATQAKGDTALANILGIKPPSVAAAKKRQQIPTGWVETIAEKFNVSADWLFFGRGPMHLGEPSGQTTLPGSEVARRLLASRPQPNALDARPLFEDTEPDCDMVLVTKVKARLSAGGGSLEVNGESVGRYAFRSDWLCRKGSPAHMVLMDVVGDSMAPDIQDGDMVLIDQGKTDIIPGAIYAVGIDEGVFVKRLSLLPGRLVISSANPAYAPIEVHRESQDMESIRVIGRVLWWCREAH